jgi:hypothetical protein
VARPTVSGIVASVVGSALARLLALVLAGFLLFMGLRWYLGRDDKQSEEDARKEAQFQAAIAALDSARSILTLQAHHTDTVYMGVVHTIRQDVARVQATTGNAITVPRIDYDRLARACTDSTDSASVVSVCAARVAARDAIIGNLERTVREYEGRPPVYRKPPRFNLTADVLVDVDSVHLVGRLDADLRILSKASILAGVELEPGKGVRKRVGFRWRF